MLSLFAGREFTSTVTHHPHVVATPTPPARSLSLILGQFKSCLAPLREHLCTGMLKTFARLVQVTLLSQATIGIYEALIAVSRHLLG